MKLDRSILYRAHFYFRRGYNVYLALLVAFLNFVVIQYKLLVSTIPILRTIFPSFTYFVLFAGTVLVILAILVGRWDIKHGTFRAEAQVKGDYDPYWQRVVRELEEIKREIQELKENSLKD